MFQFKNKPNNNEKSTSLEDNGLKMLMRILSHKNPLRMNDMKRVLEKWRGQKELRIFASDL